MSSKWQLTQLSTFLRRWRQWQQRGARVGLPVRDMCVATVFLGENEGAGFLQPTNVQSPPTMVHGDRSHYKVTPMLHSTHNFNLLPQFHWNPTDKRHLLSSRLPAVYESVHQKSLFPSYIERRLSSASGHTQQLWIQFSSSTTFCHHIIYLLHIYHTYSLTLRLLKYCLQEVLKLGGLG